MFVDCESLNESNKLVLSLKNIQGKKKCLRLNVKMSLLRIQWRFNEAIKQIIILSSDIFMVKIFYSLFPCSQIESDNYL